MLSKPDGCAACPLHHKGVGYVPDDIPDKAEYIFHGEGAGKVEAELGQPFQGPAGFVLNNWMLLAVPQLKLAKERGKVGYANVLRCMPPDNHGRPYPSGEEQKLAEACCSQYDNLKQAHTVILLGQHAQRKYFKAELEAEDASDKRLGRDVKGVMGRIGRVYERDNRRWVLAPHPAFILRQPALVLHGQRALSIAANVEKVTDVAYTAWDQAMLEVA